MHEPISAGAPEPTARRKTSPLAWAALALLLVGVIVLPALFHLIEGDSGYELIPKRSIGYADTFSTVDDIVNRYNKRRLGSPQDPVLEYLVSQLERRGLIESRKRTWSEFGDTLRDSLPDR
jgi:hypothetical protein